MSAQQRKELTPFTSIGRGVAVLGGVPSGGLDLDVTVDMTPGSYAAICFFPDLDSGMPHAALGMVALFEVTGD